MNLVRTPGLHLPVFPHDTPIAHTKSEIIHAAARDETTFVRSIAVNIPRLLSLEDGLQIAEDEMS